MSIVLSTEKLKKSFGGLVVAGGIDFGVRKNEVRCIIGPNGAGKTTFFNLVTGLIPPDSGKVLIESTDSTELKPFKRQRLGLVRTFQAPHIFPQLSVFENVQLALRSQSTIASLIKGRFLSSDETEHINKTLGKVNLLHYQNREAGSLSHGEKKRVEMAMAIVQQPKVLLMDEPTAGMTVKETEEIGELVKLIKDELSIVIVEHDMEFVRGIADKISVLYKGDLVREGPLEQLENDPFIQEIYLGSVAI